MKKTKAKIVAYDPEIYPVCLYVGTRECVKEANILFDAYDNVQDLAEDKDKGIIVFSKSNQAITACVKEKETGTAGLLVLLDLNNMKEYYTSVDTIAHESSHVADAMFEYLGIVKNDYEKGNEHYAYLVGWIAGRISNYLINYTNNEKE